MGLYSSRLIRTFCEASRHPPGRHWHWDGVSLYNSRRPRDMTRSGDYTLKWSRRWCRSDHAIHQTSYLKSQSPFAQARAMRLLSVMLDLLVWLWAEEQLERPSNLG